MAIRSVEDPAHARSDLAVLEHLNTILWDIDDLVRTKPNRNSLIDRARSRNLDLVQSVPNTTVQVVDCMLECHNYGVHYLGALRSALRGEAVHIPRLCARTRASQLTDGL